MPFGCFLQAMRVQTNYKSSDYRYRLGLYNEQRIVSQCLKSKFEIICQRTKIKGVECDLLIKTPKQEFWWIEVKSVFPNTLYPHGISNLQIRRIRRSLNWLMCDLSPKMVRGHLVTVSNQQIQWHFDFFIHAHL